MSMMTGLARWVAGKKQLGADLVDAERSLAELENAPPTSIIAAEHHDWLEKRDAARRKVESIRLAEAIATAEAAKAEAAQKANEDEVAHKDADRQAAADVKLVREIDALAAKLKDKLAELAASKARTDAANAKRGSRPLIVDAETRVRRIPERIVPASYRDEIVWEDAQGRRPYTYRKGPDGELIPTELGFERKVVRVCQRNERVEPARMPPRLADSIKLFALDGSQIWPPR